MDLHTLDFIYLKFGILCQDPAVSGQLSRYQSICDNHEAKYYLSSESKLKHDTWYKLKMKEAL